MMRAGMNAARLNFSHGSHASHKALINAVRLASKRAKKNVMILADLQGPKIRLGQLPSVLKCKAGDVVRLPLTMRGFGKHLKKGALLLIDDGRVEAEYISGKADEITVKIKSGGELSSHVGINAPGVKLKGVRILTEKDFEDVKFAVSQNVDWLIQSFVTKAGDVNLLREFVSKNSDCKHAPKIMAKIERAEAVKNAEQIISAADAVLIGRGDLGLDVPPEQVPLAQKKIIQLCREAGKPVVVATHMLESMIKNPLPTRAEVSDVANAVIDHTDAVMLSGETAKGAYPLEAVQMMNKIIVEIEKSVYDDIPPRRSKCKQCKEHVFAFMLAELVYAGRIQNLAVMERDEKLISALNLYRPEVPAFILCEDARSLRQEIVRWAVEPVKISEKMVDANPEEIARFLNKQRQVAKGKTVTVIGYRACEPVFTTVKM
jgi:pyruvate kinase